VSKELGLRDHLAAAGIYHAALHEGDMTRAEAMMLNGHDHISALTRAAILNSLEQGDLTLAEIETIFGEGVLHHVYDQPVSGSSEAAENESVEEQGPDAEDGGAEEGDDVRGVGEDHDEGDAGPVADAESEGVESAEDEVGAAAKSKIERLTNLIDLVVKELREIVSEPAEEKVENGDGSRSAPVVVVSSDDIARAAERIDGEATEAQRVAGNYRKAHVQFDGFDLTIETPRGGIRTGKREDGSEWKVKMPAAYGYLKRTAGADDEQVDIFLVDHASPGRVFAIDQIDPETGMFDEHKIVLGARSEREARHIYGRAFSDGSGPTRIGTLTQMTSDELREWLQSDGGKKPIGDLPQPYEARRQSNL
jgi:hypothetical protein